MQLSEFVILVLAVESLTELLYGAEILEGVRNYLKRYSFFKRLLRCKYCLSFWASGIVFFLWLIMPWIVWLLALQRGANRLHDLWDLMIQAKIQLLLIRSREV